MARQADGQIDRQMDRRTERQGWAGQFVHIYYLLEREGIKPPSRQVEEFPLREELENCCLNNTNVSGGHSCSKGG